MEEQGRPAAVAEPKLKTPPAPVAARPPAVTPDGKIGIEDFTKVELRVGLVKVAEKVKNADKLLRLEVDIGGEVRQIVAGIAEAYAPETLVGRKVVIVANLAPRKLRGLESNGMIVAASLEGGQAGAGGISGRGAGRGEAEVAVACRQSSVFSRQRKVISSSGSGSGSGSGR